MLSPETLGKKILGDRYNSIVFKKGRVHEVSLVGGYIRDALMGTTSSDRDYIVNGDIKSFVYRIRDIFRGTIVEFRKQNLIRIALREGLTLDFSNRAGDIREDLSKRDFTMNALAWSPGSGLTDYFGGVADIRKKRICAISQENLISDPLRMLRAYRFASEINGSIDYKTRRMIKRLHDRIKHVSPERITLELFHLLNQRRSSKYLKMALDDRLLTRILFFPFSKLEKNIRGIYALENAYFKKLPRKVKVLLDKKFAQNLLYKGLLCLEILLQNAAGSSREIEYIEMSNKINRQIELVLKGMKKWVSKKSSLGDRLFDVFLAAKEASMDLLIIKNRPDLFAEYRRFVKIWKHGFLNTGEIIEISQQKGQGIGEAIEELKRSQFTGKIKSKKQAIELTRKYAKRAVLDKAHLIL